MIISNGFICKKEKYFPSPSFFEIDLIKICGKVRLMISSTVHVDYARRKSCGYILEASHVLNGILMYLEYRKRDYFDKSCK